MSLANNVTQFNQNTGKINQIVNGDASTVVQTDGGPVRSIAKLLADNQAIISAQSGLGANLAGNGGAALVGTSDGTTIQANVDSLKNSVTQLGQNKADASALAAKADASALATKADASALDAKADKNYATLTRPTIKGYIEQLQMLTGATVTFDPAQGTLAQITISANTTIVLPAPVDGVCFVLALVYTGVFTPTFSGGGTLRWANGNVIPTPTKVNGAIDKYVFTCMSGKTLAQDGGRNF